MVVIYTVGSTLLLQEVLPSEKPLLRSRVELLYLLGLVPLELYCRYVSLQGYDLGAYTSLCISALSYVLPGNPNTFNAVHVFAFANMYMFVGCLVYYVCVI